MENKYVKDSKTIMTELVLPNDTNPLNNLRGGKLLHWMDIAAAISCQRHSGHAVVTVSVDNVIFKAPIKVGDIVTIHAYVTRAFTTSMEARIEVWGENIPNKRKYKCNEAYYTFVALDGYGNKTDVDPITPETAKERELYESAIRRRELRMLMAGRIKPNDATNLKALFE